MKIQRFEWKNLSLPRDSAEKRGKAVAGAGEICAAAKQAVISSIELSLGRIHVGNAEKRNGVGSLF